MAVYWQHCHGYEAEGVAGVPRADENGQDEDETDVAIEGALVRAS